jgi:hypothetical protein
MQNLPVCFSSKDTLLSAGGLEVRPSRTSAKPLDEAIDLRDDGRLPGPAFESISFLRCLLW